MALPHSLRAFRHRDFRLYFAGQGIAQTGTWLQTIATSWLIYELSGSAFLLGLATFAQFIPMLLLGPFAGVWVDRQRKRKVLLITQGFALAQSLAMLALVASGHVQPWHLIAANLVLGILNAFDSPARQAQLVELVGGNEDLPNAIAFSSLLMNSARFVGPMLGGAVIAGFGEVWGFALNSLLRGAVILALWLIRAEPRPTEKGGSGWLGPYLGRDVFHGGSETLGYLIGAGGFGAVSGMVHLAVRPSVRGLLSQIPFAGGAAGIALIVFSFSESLWIALPMLYFVGMGTMITAASTNTALQTIMEDRMRARVVSIYMMAFLGVTPLGGLFAGTLAERIGPPATLALGGAFPFFP